MSDLEDNNLREAELLLAMTTDNAGGETEPGHIKTPNYRQSDDEMEILAADTAWHNDMEEELSENERYSIPSAQVRQKEQIQKRPKREHVTSNESKTPPSRKRQHSETASLEAKIAKTRDSIKTLKRHIESKTYPKITAVCSPSKYSTRCGI